MRTVPNTTRPISSSETSGKDGDFTVSFTGKSFYEVIDRANSVVFTSIFKHYGIRLDEHNTKTTCPFLSHKGGRERTPSFNYYPYTNTFFCFGCKKGSTPVDFVAEKEKTTKLNAAYKILEWFGSEADNSELPAHENYSERLEIMMDFSNSVREFRSSHTSDKAFEFIEYICRTYDDINTKRDLSNDALRSVVDNMKKVISAYIGL
jgi:hypothetical protein